MSDPLGSHSPPHQAALALRRWWHAARGEEAGPEGPRLNRRLTSVVGLVLVAPLAVALATGALFDPLWRAHYFVGMLVLPLSVLKLASTGYRAARYYLRSSTFREAGPPLLPLRLLAPFLAASLLVVSATGVQMWLSHSQAQPWSTLHSASAVLFALTVGVHLLYYLPAALGSTRAELGPAAASPGLLTRRAALVGSVVFGVVLASAVTATAAFPQRDHLRPAEQARSPASR